MMLATVGAVALVIALAVTVLARRERRRARTGAAPGARRIEAAATRGMRDARLTARAYRSHGSAAGVSGLRGRDPGLWRL
ncbi:hypothetical protein [Streptomyces sp. NPDC048172]|uniref:hypothetical protein n=1 Tax=Streptomyces sp. NPDC048172 TaxID=3365505 RepID=UPI0037240638